MKHLEDHHFVSSTHYAAFRSQRYFPALDGLRAISILLVLTWHVSERQWWYLSGYTGVMIFFVLSGFLIHTLLLREEETEGNVSLKSFYLRRSFRILPLYFTVLAAYIVLAQAPMFRAQAHAFRAALPYYLTGFNDLAPYAPFNQSWSLGVEEKFYLVWPILAFLALGTARFLRMPLMWLLALCPFVAGAFGHLGWLVPYAIIMMGCTLAACLDMEHVYRRLQRFASGFGFVIIPGLCLLFQIMLGLHPDRTRPIYGWLLMGYVFSIALLLLWGVACWSPLHSLLSSRVMRYIGQRSYGIYLVHLLCLSATQRILPPRNTTRTWLLLVMTTAVSLAVAEVLYRLVEHPAISLGRRLQQTWLHDKRRLPIATPALSDEPVETSSEPHAAIDIIAEELVPPSI